MEDLPSPNSLAQLMDELWAVLGRSALPEDSRLEPMIERSRLILPATETYSSVFAHPAFNAVCAVIYTLEGYNGDQDRLALVGRMAYDAIEVYLEKVDHPNPAAYISPAEAAELNRLSRDAMAASLRRQREDFEGWMIQHPIMLSELAKQRDDLLLLAGERHLSSVLLAQLRESSQFTGLQPFHRGIVLKRSYSDDQGASGSA
jgi:hypothetical protein